MVVGMRPNITLYIHCLSFYPLSRLQNSNSHFKIWDIARTDTKWVASVRSPLVRHLVDIIHIEDSKWLTNYSAASPSETAAIPSLSIKNTSLLIFAFGFHFILSLFFPLSSGTPAISSSSALRERQDNECDQQFDWDHWHSDQACLSGEGTTTDSKPLSNLFDSLQTLTSSSLDRQVVSIPSKIVGPWVNEVHIYFYKFYFK